MFDDKIINEMKVYLKGRKILNDKEVESIKALIMEDFNAQKKLKVEDRKGYFSKDGADYLIFKTDDEAIPDLKNKGKFLNDIRKTKNGNWQYWARFPLKTSESASSAARATIFDESEEVPEWCKLKMIVAAKGRMTEKYKLTSSKDYAKALKDFVKEYNEREEANYPPGEYQHVEFSEIDKSDYIVNYTFNLDQVLEMKSLK